MTRACRSGLTVDVGWAYAYHPAGPAPAVGIRAAASASAAPGKVLLIGGSSEIGLAILGALPLGPATEVLLAGRNPAQLGEAAGKLPGQVSVLPYDASDPDGYQDLTAGAVKPARLT